MYHPKHCLYSELMNISKHYIQQNSIDKKNICFFLKYCADLFFLNMLGTYPQEQKILGSIFPIFVFQAPNKPILPINSKE